MVLYVIKNIHQSMFRKKIIASSLILLILLICLGGVSAEENATESVELPPINEDVEINEPQQSENHEELAVNESAPTDKQTPDFDIGFDDTYVDRRPHPDGPFLFIYPKVENMTGNFTIFVDGNKCGFGDVGDFQDPWAEIPESYYKLGNHTLKVEYSGNDIYASLTKIHNFTVQEVAIIMMNEEYCLENDAIIVDLPAKATGTATIYINGEKKKAVKVTPADDEVELMGGSNILSIELDEYLKFNETYNVTVTYSGKCHGKALSATKSGRITSVTYPLEGNIFSPEEYGIRTEVDIITPKDILKENLHVYVDNESIDFEYFGNDEDYRPFTYIAQLPILKVGLHNITLTYSGDEKYPAKTFNTTLKIFSEIKIPDEVTFNSKGSIKLRLPNDATGNLTAYIGKNNESYELYKTQEMVNGTAIIEIIGEHVGEYHLKVTYDGNYEVENITEEIFSVNPIIKYPSKMTWGENKYVTLQADSKAGGTLCFYKYGKLYKKANVVNGSARISLANLPMGDYYDGTSIEYVYGDYRHEIWGYWLTVRPIMKLSGPKTMNYGDTSYYTYKISGANGKVAANKMVEIKIGKKAFKVKTNSKGVAKLKIPNTVTPGTYAVHAGYSDIYVIGKLNVKQVLTLKAVKVKKSAKKLTLTATLKKGKKAIKNAKVTFKFNGKTYKTKTNKKGIAKVTIKKSVLKKLKVGKKVTYQATYLKNTVKKTVKIRK